MTSQTRVDPSIHACMGCVHITSEPADGSKNCHDETCMAVKDMSGKWLTHRISTTAIVCQTDGHRLRQAHAAKTSQKKCTHSHYISDFQGLSRELGPHRR